MTKVDRQAGFTLPELLIALALLGLLAAYTLGALQNVSRARVIHERIDATTEVEAVRRHLVQTIQATRSVFHQRDPDQPAVLAFTGNRQSVSMVVPSDPRLERGGLYVVDYKVLSDKKLTTTRQLYRARAGNKAGEPATITLLDDVIAINFAYFGPPEKGAPPVWQNTWPRNDILPMKISVELLFPEKPGRTWQRLVAIIPGAQ